MIYSLMMPNGRKFGILLKQFCCSPRPLEEVDFRVCSIYTLNLLGVLSMTMIEIQEVMYYSKVQAISRQELVFPFLS